jgi:hypothetical protein
VPSHYENLPGFSPVPLCQGTTSVVPLPATIEPGFSPCALLPSRHQQTKAHTARTCRASAPALLCQGTTSVVPSPLQMERGFSPAPSSHPATDKQKPTTARTCQASALCFCVRARLHSCHPPSKWNGDSAPPPPPIPPPTNKSPHCENLPGFSPVLFCQGTTSVVPSPLQMERGFSPAPRTSPPTNPHQPTNPHHRPTPTNGQPPPTKQPEKTSRRQVHPTARSRLPRQQKINLKTCSHQPKGTRSPRPQTILGNLPSSPQSHWSDHNRIAPAPVPCPPLTPTTSSHPPAPVPPSTHFPDTT